MNSKTCKEMLSLKMCNLCARKNKKYLVSVTRVPAVARGKASLNALCFFKSPIGLRAKAIEWHCCVLSLYCTVEFSMLVLSSTGLLKECFLTGLVTHFPSLYMTVHVCVQYIFKPL